MQMQEEICQAHMKGQYNAGCKHPSWSEAFAYWKSVEEKFTSTKKQSAPLCTACGVELSCRNHCHDTNSPHGIVVI